jgi:hypothetical protein
MSAARPRRVVTTKRTFGPCAVCSIIARIGRTKGVFALGAHQAIRLSRLPARALPEREDRQLFYSLLKQHAIWGWRTRCRLLEAAY